MAHLEPPMLLALLPAATVFFALNNALAGTAAALDQGASIRSFLREDMRFQMMMAATVAAFAPLVTAVAVHAEFLIPLLAVPLVALHRGSRAGRLSEHRAMHDSLTQLPNRSHFRKLAQQAVSTATREGRAAAMLVMDLDRFKEINDTLGHHSGDLLLQQVGPRLRTVLRPDDVVARFGGDEFAVLIREVDGHEQLVSLGRRIVEALERPFAVEGIQLNVSASVGIVCAPADGTDVDTLLQRGDVAMYNAKRERAGWAFYDSARDDHSIERLALAGELRLALDRDELVLHYQPQIDMRTGRVFGVEALARWQHPERGLLLPASFIPLAEHTGLMREVTTAVMSLAVAQSAAWQAAGLDLQVSFNASSRDVLDQRLVTDLQELLDTHDVRADSLCLEITETMLMADPHRAQQTLQQLSSAGVRIAVDDFGTGYSSLAYLKRLPIDEIKIDRSFVMNMADDRSDAVIVASTIELAHSLGLSALAEGVEGQAAYDELVRLGCEKAQGYFFSRPIPAHTLLAWVEEWGTVPAPDAGRAAAGGGVAAAPAIAHA
jgi:diguanylate cyclase (GGDEF)-like protein